MENNILVIADEIHCDLIMPGYNHIPFPSISEKFANNSITCTAPSKTFNLAGLKTSVIIIPNKELRDEFMTTMGNVSIRGPTIFGALATKMMYDKGQQWLAAVLKYVHNNYKFFKEFLAKNLPKAYVFPLEGTYLVWVDFRALGIEAKKLDEIIKQEAQVALDDGAMFGPAGAGFQRFNVACPRKIVKEALERITKALKEHV